MWHIGFILSLIVFYYKLHKLYPSGSPHSTVTNTQCHVPIHTYTSRYMYEKRVYLWLIPQIGKLHRVLTQALFSESGLEKLRHKIIGLCMYFIWLSLNTFFNSLFCLNCYLK